MFLIVLYAVSDLLNAVMFRWIQQPNVLYEHYITLNPRTNQSINRGVAFRVIKVMIITVLLVMFNYLKPETEIYNVLLGMAVIPSLFGCGQSLGHILYVRYVSKNPDCLKGQLEGDAELFRTSPFNCLELLVPMAFIAVWINSSLVWGGVIGLTVALGQGWYRKWRRMRVIIKLQSY